MKTLVMTGGGTAGHCTPALALLPQLNDHFDKICYIGSVGGIESTLVKYAGLDYYPITTVKLKRTLTVKNLAIPFKLFKGISEAKAILKKLKPSVVFSKGGFVALPVAIAAKQLKIPLVLHESDLTPGLANKLCAKSAREVLTSFKQTAEELPNGLWTGAPISAEIFGASRAEALARYGFKGDKPVLLCLGGSTGSRAINRVLRGILPNLTKRYDVLHLTGKNNTDTSLLSLKGYVQVEFEREMKYAYAVADVAVSRAGSNCIFELLAQKLPALLIPLPKAESRGDQILNAEYFAQKRAFLCLKQEDMTEQTLEASIQKLYDRRINLSLAMKPLSVNGNKKIAERIIRYSK